MSGFFILPMLLRGYSIHISISSLLMPWLLPFPGHQQPQYWKASPCLQPAPFQFQKMIQNVNVFLCFISSTYFIIQHIMYACILLVLKPEYSKKELHLEYSTRTWSTPWMLMHWLLVLQDQQQLWHWLCRINKSFSSPIKGFKNLCYLSIGKW